MIQSLTREHVIFAQLLERLESVAAGDEKTARRDVRNTLLILLSALDRHEKTEDIVFGNPSYASREDAHLILDQVAEQHQRIQELRLEFLQTSVSSDSVPMARLKLLVDRMAESLRAHFRTEEETLWPHYENFSRSLDASIRRRLDESVKALENDIASNSESLTQYLQSKKIH
ncbi:MAG: hemerythrin domain-containing protein [Elusimicrobiota bacterium]